ncbi:MAG: HAMP domain-containing histidine kinase [Bacteroidetes bacterium]|nr:HAMP domain-containing histidine kinase [Bacteroidota bacterium]
MSQLFLINFELNMLKTIKEKFIWSTILFIMLVVGIPVTFIMSQFAENFHQRSTIMLDATMDMLRYGLDNAMMQGSSKNVQGIVNEISAYDNINHIRIFNKNGIVTYATDLTEVGKNFIKLAPDHINPYTADGMERKIILLKDKHAYSAFEAIQNENRCQNCHGNDPVIAYLDVDSHLTNAERYFYTGSYHILFLAVVIIIVLAIGFIYFFEKLINNPLKKFLSAFDEVEKGNLGIRFNPVKDDEFGQLEKNFDNMVSEIQNSRNEIEELHFKQLQHTHKLATIGELTTEMAHEINNHTAIIMTRADYLQLESMNNPNLQKYEEDFDVLLDQSLKVSKITGNILKHSKKSEKDFSEVSLTKVINDSLQIFEPIVKKKNIILTKEFNIEDVFVYADAYQLDQVFTNLYNNSIDSLSEGGQLKIILDKNNNGKIQITITDNGEGIDSKYIDQIFSPFFTTKQAEKGTGLGLYIVKNICKNHNAGIKCKSEKGKGTSFIITFN